VARSWKLTVRAGSRVEHERFDSLDAALAALERHLAVLRGAPRRETARAFVREIEPVAQVAARLEIGQGLLGPHGGVDVRGDGSSEAWSGRVAKRLLDGDDPVAALRAALAS
jgi:hypothetical protein